MLKQTIRAGLTLIVVTAATLEAVKIELALKLAEAHRRTRLDERVISFEELEAAKAAADAAQAKVVEAENPQLSAGMTCTVIVDTPD